MEDELQYISLMSDYLDRAFEIEIESEMNALRIKRQLIKKECDSILQSHNEQEKELEHNYAINRSQYISDARKKLMNETKNVFENLQIEAAKQIEQKLATDSSFNNQLLDKLIIEGSKQFDNKAILSVSPNDRSYVQSNLAKYKQETGIEIELGKDLEQGERGVKIYNDNMKICVNSTIAQRLKQAMKVKAPELNAIILPDVALIE